MAFLWPGTGRDPGSEAAAMRQVRAAAGIIWSNGKAAYRCRHGYTSATHPDPGRPKNLYVREDHILPRLAALAILQASDGRAPRSRKQEYARVTASAEAADLIDHLCATGVTIIIYDPATRTIRTDTKDVAAVSVG